MSAPDYPTSATSPCPCCEGRGKGCDDCFGEGTYGAYAAEQLHRLAKFLIGRRLTTKQDLQRYGWEI